MRVPSGGGHGRALVLVLPWSILAHIYPILRMKIFQKSSLSLLEGRLRSWAVLCCASVISRVNVDVVAAVVVVCPGIHATFCARTSVFSRAVSRSQLFQLLSACAFVSLC